MLLPQHNEREANCAQNMSDYVRFFFWHKCNLIECVVAMLNVHFMELKCVCASVAGLFFCISDELFLWHQYAINNSEGEDRQKQQMSLFFQNGNEYCTNRAFTQLSRSFENLRDHNSPPKNGRMNECKEDTKQKEVRMCICLILLLLLFISFFPSFVLRIFLFFSRKAAIGI